MSTRTLRRHSRRSLPRVRAPREGPRGVDGHDNGNGPPDIFHGGPGNSNEHGHGHAFGNDGNHGLGNNGGGNGNGHPHDTSPISPPPSPTSPPTAPPGGGGDSDPPPGGGTNADGTGSHGSASGSTDAENMGGSNGANSGSNPPANANGGSSSATSVSDPDSSRSSDGTPSKTSDSTPSVPPVNAQISDSTTGAPGVSAAVISGGGSSAVITPAPSPSPNPSSSGEVTQAAALSPHSNSGAIAGGVVGAVLFFAIALGAWIVYKRRRKNRLAPSAEYLSNASRYPFAQGFGVPANRNEKSQLQAGNYGGAGTGGAGNANFRSLNSRFGELLENNPQMEQYRDERPVPSSVPLSRPPQPEVLYSTRPAGTPPPAVPAPGSTPGTPTTPSGRRIPFGTGTFQFPPRPQQPQQPITLQ